jgi:hypothetical protein
VSSPPPKYAIRYRSRGTIRGNPVGFVYAENIEHLSGPGAWSSVRDPRDATLFDTREDAERAIASVRYGWDFASVVEVT